MLRGSSPTLRRPGAAPPPDPPPVDPPPPPEPPPSGSSFFAAVIPPSAYSLPSGATVSVSTSTELIAALAGSTRDIILENGVYDNPTAFNGGTHRVYARNLLGATLLAGINFGGNTAGSPLLQGVVVDVSTPAKAASANSCVYPWGLGAQGFQMLDCSLKGHRVVAYGVNCYSPNLTIWERCKFFEFTDVALRLSTNTSGAGVTIKRIRDMDVDYVTRAIPGASNGTAEAGLFIGHPVTEHVYRVKIRNVSWSGIEPVNENYNTIYSDLDIDMGGIAGANRTGVYFEHYSWGCTIQNFLMVNCKTAITHEWNYGGTQPPSVKDGIIKNGKIVGTGTDPIGVCGIYYDEGNGPNNKIDNVTFDKIKGVCVGNFRAAAGTPLEITNCTYILEAPGFYGHAGFPKQYSTDHVYTYPNY